MEDVKTQKDEGKQSNMHQHFTKAKPPKRNKKFNEDKASKSSNMFVNNLDSVKISRSEIEESNLKNARKYLSSSEDESQCRIVNTLKLKYPIMKDYCCLE